MCKFNQHSNGFLACSVTAHIVQGFPNSLVEVAENTRLLMTNEWEEVGLTLWLALEEHYGTVRNEQ